jgi:hypothetical protein
LARLFVVDLEFLLFRQDGVLSLGQARRYLSAEAIRHRLAAGRWQRLRRGDVGGHEAAERPLGVRDGGTAVPVVVGTQSP